MISARVLARDYSTDPQRTLAELSEGLRRGRAGQPGGVSPYEFSLRELAQEFFSNTGGERIGRRYVQEVCDPRAGGRALMESSEGVDSTAFAHVTGQLLASRILQEFESEQFVASRLIPSRPTRLSGERIPGVGRLKDEGDDFKVSEGMPFDSYGFTEEYIETPATDKRGLIVSVTREAIYFDLTGRILEQAARVGEVLGLNKEKRLLRVLLGIDNSYRSKGASYDTYQDTAPWINSKTGVDLVDWTDVEQAELLFADMLDPSNGEPVLVNPNTIFCMPSRLRTAQRIVNATEVRTGDTSTAAGVQTASANPLSGAYQVAASRLAYRELIAAGATPTNAAKYWYLGDFARAFAYMENWPITIVQAPANSEAEFTHDVVFRVKASERGAAAVLEPRAVVKLTG